MVLSTHQLTKDFGRLRAVDNLDLSVCRGDIFGFLGPNGAGKTTTIRMIFGLIYPTSGYAQILDHRVPDQRQEALRHVGGFVDIPAFYPNMTGRRNLRLLGRMHGDVTEARISEVLDIVGLGRRGDSRVARLLPRHEATARHRAGVDARTRARHPGRTHQRPRSPRA